MPTRRYFSNFAPRQTLANSIGSADTTCQIAGSFAGWPVQFPFYATLGYGLSSAEIVSVTNIVGTTATIARAQNGSVAVAHPAGETMDQTAIAQDFDEANAHTTATSGVHGISGNVVGDTDAQTLTNKTLTAPVINGANIVGATGITTGDLTATGVSTVDSLTVNGAITLADGLPEKTTTDWNTATLPGLYTSGPASANAPTNSSLSGLVVNVSGATQQIVWDGAGNEWRRVNTGTWSAWGISGPNRPSARVTITGSFSLTNGAWTQIAGGASTFTVDYDPYGLWNPSVNVFYLTNYPGLWRAHGRLVFPSNATGYRGVGFAWNSAAVDPNRQTYLATSGSTVTAEVNTQGSMPSAGSPYVRLMGYQNSGAAMSLNANGEFSVEWIGPLA